MDRGSRQATAHGVTKSDTTERTNTHTHTQQILEAILDSKVWEDDCKELVVVNSCDEPIECGAYRSVFVFFSSTL